MPYISDANFEPNRTGQRLPENYSQQAQETSFIDDLLKLRKQRKLEQLVDAELGNNGGQQHIQKPPEESLAASIVNKAMEISSQANQRVQDLANRNDESAQKARAEADKAKNDLFAIVSQQIGGALEKIEKMRDEIKTGSKPRDLAEEVKSARDLLTILQPPQREAPVVSGVDSNVTVTLEKMRMDHEMSLKNLDLQLQKMNQEFQLALAKLNSDESYRKREYEDNNSYRQRNMDTFSDIAASIAAGFGGNKDEEREESIEVPRESPVGRRTTAKDRNIVAPPSINNPGIVNDKVNETGDAQESFECQNCGDTIFVKPGQKVVVCKKCNSEYNIDYR